MKKLLENVKIISKTGTTQQGKEYKNLVLTSDNPNVSSRNSENGWIGNTLMVTDKFKPAYSEFKQQFPGVDVPTKLATKDKNVWGWGYWINNPEDEAKKIDFIKKLAKFLNDNRNVNPTGDEEINKFEGFEEVQAFIDRLKDLLGDINIQDESKQRELREGIETFIKELAESVDAVTANEKLNEFFDWSRNFHNFSFNNQILIYIQKPNAKKVGSKTTWASVGLKPKEGAFQIWLWRPHLRPKSQALKNKIIDDYRQKYGAKLSPRQQKELNDELKKPMVDSSKRPILYPTYDVSDVVDDKGEPGGIMQPPNDLQWFSDKPDEKADQIANALEEIIPSYGIDFAYYEPKGGENGYSANGKIRIASKLVGIGKASTMIHELSHEIMHQNYIKSVKAKGDKKPSEKDKLIQAAYVGKDVSKTLELQAEGVAYVVMRQFGISDVQYAVNYIALWRGTNESVLGNLDIITRTANIIINDVNTHMQSTVDVEDKESSEFGDYDEEQPEQPVAENSEQQGSYGSTVTRKQVADLLGLEMGKTKEEPIKEFEANIYEAKEIFKSILN